MHNNKNDNNIDTNDDNDNNNNYYYYWFWPGPGQPAAGDAAHGAVADRRAGGLARAYII